MSRFFSLIKFFGILPLIASSLRSWIISMIVFLIWSFCQMILTIFWPNSRARNLKKRTKFINKYNCIIHFLDKISDLLLDYFQSIYKTPYKWNFISVISWLDGRKAGSFHKYGVIMGVEKIILKFWCCRAEILRKQNLTFKFVLQHPLIHLCQIFKQIF